MSGLHCWRPNWNQSIMRIKLVCFWIEEKKKSKRILKFFEMQHSSFLFIGLSQFVSSYSMIPLYVGSGFLLVGGYKVSIFLLENGLPLCWMDNKEKCWLWSCILLSSGNTTTAISLVLSTDFHPYYILVFPKPLQNQCAYTFISVANTDIGYCYPQWTYKIHDF